MGLNEQDNNMYTPEEQDVLDLTKKVRVDIVKSMVKEGVDKLRSGDIRVLNEVAGSLDKLITDSASNRLKMQDSENNKANAEMIVAAIMSKRDTNIVIDNSRTLEISDDVIDIDPVTGEMDINPQKLDPTDFLPNNEEE